MLTTRVKVKNQIKLNNPVLIEGLPGLGMIGRITTRYLARQLKAKKLADLYSPHFPHYVLVNKKGNIRLLRGEFYFWKDHSKKRDLIIYTGDRQAQTIEGQYEIASHILNFAKKYHAKTIVTIGGYQRAGQKEPRVFAASTDTDLLNNALKAQALASTEGTPIVGTAGLLLGLAGLKQVAAICLLGETYGYLPDPRAAKSILKVLQKMLKIEISFDELDKEIKKAEGIIRRMQEIEKRREKYAKKTQRVENEKVSYIS